MLQSSAPFIYRTRGIYMFLALVASIIIKALSRGTTPMTLFVLGLVLIFIVQAFRMYSASFLWGRQAGSQKPRGRVPLHVWPICLCPQPLVPRQPTHRHWCVPDNQRMVRVPPFPWELCPGLRSCHTL